MSSALQDRVYIVTGGSQGFGLAIARSLVGQGARVGLVSRSQENLDNALAELGSGHACGVAASVGDPAAIADAFEQVRQHFGRLDGLVNNAGMARPNAIEHLKKDEVELQVQTNFLGVIFCCQAAIPLLRGGDSPRIVNISSASAHHYDEMCHLSVYAATKAAVERFTRDLRTELQADCIGVTCIRPGAAGTNFADGWDLEAIMAGFAAWSEVGTHMDTGMESRQVGDAVAYVLAQPNGVAVDLLEIRPNRPVPKNPQD